MGATVGVAEMAVIKDTDRGLSALMARRIGELAATVGVHADEGAGTKEGEEITVAEVAAIHEYGLGVPKRSWLRDFVDENEAKLRQMLTASYRQVMSGKLTEEQALTRFGLAVEGMIKKRITKGIEPELLEETKERKKKMTGGAKDTPLILTSQFISSITHEVHRRL